MIDEPLVPRPDDRDARRFDRAMRERHEASLAHLPAATLTRLRAARWGMARPARQRGNRWRIASACAAAIVLTVAIQLQTGAPAPAAGPAPSPRTGPAEAGGALEFAVPTVEEDPDLYLWLAYNDDAAPPVSEQ